jgi:hypothetical protein
MEPDPTITCIDCGEVAYLLTKPPEDGQWRPGEVVIYRCSGCNDRWDLVLPDEDDLDPYENNGGNGLGA